ncbi:MAG: arylsulfatase, partial [Verrucomicrobia bacterium]|nr:arylsulfatase [Verrucomicrobiota bacterium]
MKQWRADLNCPVPTELNPKFVSARPKKASTFGEGREALPSYKEGEVAESRPGTSSRPAEHGDAEAGSPVASQQPNVIYILADDLGYGDLGCYGQKKLKTPNIDRIATEGMRFTDHYSGNTVCSPSRAVLMTGQHPGHVHCRGNGGENRFALDPKMTTLPRLFKNAGYATGAYGKWGLGETSLAGDTNPQAHGFDHFSGWKSQGIAHTYYPKNIVRDGKEIPLKKGTFVHDLVMRDAFDFIRKNAKAKKPFFCYIPTAVPHAAMHAPPHLHEKWRKVYPQFDKKIGRYGAGKGQDCPDVKNPVAGYAAMMENLDNQIGELFDILKAQGVDENTIIMFSSDNGAHREGGHQPDFWDSNGPLRGIKRDLYEGGIRAPFMVRWPAKVAAGSRSAHISAFWDILPTMADIIGQPVPEQSDGISILPTLRGKGKQPQHEHLYHEFIQAGSRIPYTARSVRSGKWKAVQVVDKDGTLKPIELYNLKDDLGETRNLAGEFPEVLAKL